MAILADPSTRVSPVVPGSWAHEADEQRGPWRLGGMVAPVELLPHDVLPTDSLRADGRPTGALRDELRRIPDLRNAANVASVWLQTFGLIYLAAWIDHPAMWVATFVLMGRGLGLFAILTHEAAHRMLFTKKSVNDFVGRWLLGYLAFVPTDLYRRGHMAHHKEEFGPAEPDIAFYGNYPITRSSFWRKLRRDAFLISGWKNLKPLLLAARSKESRPLAMRILGTQAMIALVLGFTVAWWAYPVLWLAPWMTVWRVLNRLRSIGEHGGLHASKDRRETTHHVRQSWIARFWFTPFNTGWHLAHHVDSGVPFQNLPRLQRELEQTGWVTAEITYPNYRMLWRTLRSAPTT